jgi:hypothetical protein
MGRKGAITGLLFHAVDSSCVYGWVAHEEQLHGRRLKRKLIITVSNVCQDCIALLASPSIFTPSTL